MRILVLVWISALLVLACDLLEIAFRKYKKSKHNKVKLSKIEKILK